MKAELQLSTCGELAAVERSQLQRLFGAKDAGRLWILANGEDEDPVKDRELPKSIGCGKSFSSSRWAAPGSTYRHIAEQGKQKEEDAERMRHRPTQGKSTPDVDGGTDASVGGKVLLALLLLALLPRLLLTLTLTLTLTLALYSGCCGT